MDRSAFECFCVLIKDNNALTAEHGQGLVLLLAAAQKLTSFGCEATWQRVKPRLGTTGAASAPV